MDTNIIFKEIGDFITNNDNFLITAHFSPDGDNLGACIAFYLMLKDMGKSSIVVNEDLIIDKFDFLLENKSTAFKQFSEMDPNVKFDNVIIVDTANIDRIGKVSELISEKATVINIDHHFTNANYGNINFIDGNSASASQLVYKIFKENNLSISTKISDAILVGILSDTGGLKFRNTNVEVISIVKDLMKLGSDLADITEKIFASMSYKETMKVNKIASEIVLYEKEGIAVAYNDQKMNPLIENEPVLMILNSIEEAKVTMFVRKADNNKLKVSLRSNSYFNVSDFAGKWGGGGHKNAAGMRYDGTFEEFKKDVVEKLKLEVSRG
ncbi:MAG: bifunctional oligoribonuclease/PAP phosphatase NrnA [Candidatus Delongbacteria bacterium]|jgi:phosphoesterase RecJ-like protein|nr:bifunctional oligoribonuclease/PAP phosphatase NrnA [Candidatus Delongbacteria bacterium]